MRHSRDRGTDRASLCQAAGAFRREGLQTSCRQGGLRAVDGVDGGQGEAVRVPQAQGTPVKLPVGEDARLLPSLLTLSDVFRTGHHRAMTAEVGPRTSVTVIGDGAAGLSATPAARRLGAERIPLMGRHPGHDRRARLWRSCAAGGRGDRLAAQEL